MRIFSTVFTIILISNIVKSYNSRKNFIIGATPLCQDPFGMQESYNIRIPTEDKVTMFLFLSTELKEEVQRDSEKQNNYPGFLTKTGFCNQKIKITDSLSDEILKLHGRKSTDLNSTEYHVGFFYESKYPGMVKKIPDDCEDPGKVTVDEILCDFGELDPNKVRTISENTYQYRLLLHMYSHLLNRDSYYPKGPDRSKTQIEPNFEKYKERFKGK
uniref:NTR domain-containing protein n=1 Tax=Strongyloides papillosus TaxID=174720 RepID=A0A0N5BD99_STREA